MIKLRDDFIISDPGLINDKPNEKSSKSKEAD
jgi:hypothetical protein